MHIVLPLASPVAGLRPRDDLAIVREYVTMPVYSTSVPCFNILMQRNPFILITAFALIILAVVYWPRSSSAPVTTTDAQNLTITIDKEFVTLVKGRAETPTAPGSATMVVTQYFGNAVAGDLNADGIPDVAFIITRDGGGSGTFYYVVAALQTATGYEGTNAVLLGDRVAPQSTEIVGGKLIVNYADRRAGEPFSTPPSVGVSKYLEVVDGQLVDAAPPAAR